VDVAALIDVVVPAVPELSFVDVMQGSPDVPVPADVAVPAVPSVGRISYGDTVRGGTELMFVVKEGETAPPPAPSPAVAPVAPAAAAAAAVVAAAVVAAAVLIVVFVAVVAGVVVVVVLFVVALAELGVPFAAASGVQPDLIPAEKKEPFDVAAAVVAVRKARLLEAELDENEAAALFEWRKSPAFAGPSRPCPGHGLPYC
jgi:hypothetical protein